MEISSDGLAVWKLDDKIVHSVLVKYLMTVLDDKIVHSVLVKGWFNQVSHLNTRGNFQIPELLLHLW